MIKLANVSYKYKTGENVLEDINLEVKKGELVTIIGKNGSGKSSLARIIAGINEPKTGTAQICGIDTKNKEEFLELRKKCGIVFQNPENQIIFNNVHDDIAFALDNLKIENKEEKIQKALKAVGMEDYEEKTAYDLSLGQKQRATIAGVLSLEPEVLIMDEPTTMLDPEGKKEIREIVLKLKEKEFTIIYITNVIEEIFMADRVIILEKRQNSKRTKEGRNFRKFGILKRNRNNCAKNN